MIACRGAGKSYAATQWIIEKIVSDTSENLNIALTAPTLRDCLYIYVQGPDSLVSRFPSSILPNYNASKRMIEFPNGAKAALFGCEEGDLLRGAQFHYAVGENIESWMNKSTVIDELSVSTRLGPTPQICLTGVDVQESVHIARMKTLNKSDPLLYPITYP